MKRLFVFLCSCLPALGWGATYKCFDAQGRVSYTQTPEPGKRCVQPSLPEVQVIPAPPQPEEGGRRDAVSPPLPSRTPDQEIAEARRALEAARRKLAEQEALRYGDERNYQRVLDRLKPYQDAVARAEARLRELEQSGGQGTLSPRRDESTRH